MADQPLAVIDIGSNSGRMLIARSPTGEHVEVLAEERVPLRLARELRDSDEIGTEAIERTIGAVADFLTLAEAAGVARTLAVATAAVREASNAQKLIDRIRKETGLEVEIVDGDREASLAFLGAVHSLPVENGVLVDVGGGSIEVARFRDRKFDRAWTMPLGALRLSDRYITSDPPARGDRRRLVDHVVDTLREVAIPRLGEDERMVGTGGTVRTLAKMDRRERNYPIPRLHGYLIERARVDELTELVASRPITKRATLSGLSSDRADSIVGGALTLQTIMETLAAAELTVSGRGLREGIALAALTDGPAPASAVRTASVAALAGRLASLDLYRAARRAALAKQLLDAVDAAADREVSEMLGHAAMLLDSGSSLDAYNRHEHAAAVVVGSDLVGFAHEQLVLVAAIVRRADKENAGLKPFKTLLRPFDPGAVTRAAAMLALADAVERRLPAGAASAGVRTAAKSITISAPIRTGRWSRLLDERIRVVCGRRLVIEPKEASS